MRMRESAAAIVGRGGCVEAWHHASVAVVDGTGRLIATFGDPELTPATRSAIKPFLALALVESGGGDALGLGPEELAVSAASHSGTDAHVAVVKRLLARAGATAADLGCGAHLPIHYRREQRLPLAGEDKDPLRHNCSGKHAGFLALARHLGEPLAEYLDPDGRTQRCVRESLARALEVPADGMPRGIDGCSAPNYALPLVTLARGMLKLRTADARGGSLARSLVAIRDAMLAHAWLVSGDGRFDHDVMSSFPSNAVCKSGAEGIQLLAFAEPSLGVAIKVHDGADRALPPICLAVLADLGLLPAVLPARLARHRTPAVRNHRGTITGHIVANVPLERP